MLQIDGILKVLIEVHKEYNSLLSLEMQEQDEDCFDATDKKKWCHSKIKIHNWIRDAEHKRKEQSTSKSRSVASKHPYNSKSLISSSSRSSKGKRKAENGRAFNWSRISRKKIVSKNSWREIENWERIC